MFEDVKIRFADVISYVSADMGITVDDKIAEIVDTAFRAIINYLWLPYETDETVFKTPLIRLAKYYYQNEVVFKNTVSGDTQITQLTQGSRSVTFRNPSVELDNYGLTADVKAMLPPRRLRVI